MAEQKRLKVVFVGASDASGGAARAMTRIFLSLWERQDELGLDISMRVIENLIDHPAITGGKPSRNFGESLKHKVRTRYRKAFPRPRFHSPNPTLFSRARHDTGLGRELKAMNADLYVLNWLGNRTLSIEEIGKLQNKVVWQLHDMWMFSGAEHYRSDDRAASGYSPESRPSDESGPDVNREIFIQKMRHWKEHRPVIVPSRWLASESRKSQLTHSWPIFVQPYPLDTKFWVAQDRATAREHWNFSQNELVILFGAAGGTQYSHKGADLLFEALTRITPTVQNGHQQVPVSLAIFGESKEDTVIGNISVRYLGELDDLGIRMAHSAADILVVPSRLENFAQVALEGHSCGLPIVVFEGTGLTDIVDHGVTGFHAKKNDPVDLARNIQHLLDTENMRLEFGRAARERAVRLWSPDVVATAYASILREAAGHGQSSAKQYM